MNTIFFASAASDLPLPDLSTSTSATKEHLVLIVAITLVTAGALAWAFLFRRKRRRSARREERRRRRRSFIGDTAKGVAELKQYIEERKERKHGHRRRHHRPRNPTLAETGGLPPIRSDSPPPPPVQPS